jgi:hypothetical protein
MKGRALVLTTLGMVACGGLLTASILIALHGAMRGQPLDGRGWIAVGVFGGLSLVVLFIGLRAWHRERRREGPGQRVNRLLARAVPLLALGGVILGCFAGYPLSAGRVRSLDDIDRRACKQLYGKEMAELSDQLEACLPAARACRVETEHTPLGDADQQMALMRRWPKGVPMPRYPRQKLKILCMVKRLAP